MATQGEGDEVDARIRELLGTARQRLHDEEARDWTEMAGQMWLDLRAAELERETYQDTRPNTGASGEREDEDAQARTSPTDTDTSRTDRDTAVRDAAERYGIHPDDLRAFIRR